MRARRAANRLFVALALVLALPAITIGERVRRGAGRAIALRTVRIVARMCGVEFRVSGRSRLDDDCSYVFAPNHSSPLDIPAVLVARPEARFVAAAELFRIPLLAGAMRALDTVALDRHDRKRSRRQLAALSEGGGPVCVTIFPEGGIAPAGGRLPFRAGAFVAAIEARAAVVPVAIHGSDKVLPPGSKLGVRPGVVSVELLDPLSTVGMDVSDRKALRARAEAAVLESLARA